MKKIGKGQSALNNDWRSIVAKRMALLQYTDLSLADDPTSDAGTGGSGSTLDAVLSAVGNLGSAAIYATGPANSGIPVTGRPVYTATGQLINPTTGLPYAAGTVAPTSSNSTLLLVAAVALIAYFAFVKM